ncbi:MAG: hypothetical protein E6G97_25605 [Alphaproteobacteria bacterium]|nr:MAG: hypothetical protein E6G97_25605 [Alphaproteobacteria bacterium]
MSDADERRAILERLAALDTPTLVRLAGLLKDGWDNPADSGSRYLDYLQAVADSDVSGLKTSEKSYGNSWKRRGGVDTFHMLSRKWDRIEGRLASGTSAARSAPGASPYDIFEHVAANGGADGVIDDVRDLRRYLMLVEAELRGREAAQAADSARGYLDQLEAIAHSDIEAIKEKEKSHGNSWKRSGGIGAFMMFARKWDRITQRVGTRIDPMAGAPGAERDNVLEHVGADRRAEGVLDDIRDLRRYLMLVEAEMAARGAVQIGTARDNREGG